MNKKRIISGIQPTGVMTLGNYLGAVKNWQEMQDDYQSLFFIADLHALTIRQDPKEFRQSCTNFFAQLLACGVDPKKATVYFQSAVPAHCELAWLLNCNTYIGELSRMTQFKDKSQKHSENINAGLFTYPVLMAADILLFKSNLVPVGVDQKQHLEITRNIAERFNNVYGETFVVPEPYIQKTGAKICSLQDPSSKMSKSDKDANATISVFDSDEVTIKKFKRAVTDSGSEIVYREDKPGISNLLTIYATIQNKSVEDAEKEFASFGYGQFKMAVADAVNAALKPVREKYIQLLKDPATILSIAAKGAEQAKVIAEKTLYEVRDKMGLVNNQ